MREPSEAEIQKIIADGVELGFIVSRDQAIKVFKDVQRESEAIDRR